MMLCSIYFGAPSVEMARIFSLVFFNLCIILPGVSFGILKYCYWMMAFTMYESFVVSSNRFFVCGQTAFR